MNENRYNTCFKKLKSEDKIAFIPFWMIGDPTPEISLEIIRSMAKKSDILELGIPFSDPLADGPVIQDSVNRALKSGINTKKCLEIITQIRSEFPEKPIGLLVYFNLILRLGMEEFFSACKDAGVDSLIIPEIPIGEINLEIGETKENLVTIQNLSEKYDVNLVFLVSTNTPKDNLEKIFKVSESFIYAISTPSITGAKTEIAPKTIEMIKGFKQKTKTPVAVGFGISTPKHIKILKENGADGAIIGSRLISVYQEKGPEGLENFLEDCMNARG